MKHVATYVRTNLYFPFQTGLLFIWIFALSTFIGCKKFVTISSPSTDLVTATVFSSDSKATAALISVYADMAGTSFSPGESQSFTVLAGLSADELVDYSLISDRTEFYNNAISTSNPTNDALWSSAYQFIYRLNAVLEGINASTTLSNETKSRLTGEALFARSFLYFYLVNCWGDIPYITKTDYVQNATASRTAATEVYKAIVSDLVTAVNKLPADYAGTERIRPNKWAAQSLLSRVYLFMKDWQHAESSASAVLANTDVYHLEPDLNNVFLNTSAEAIWQLMPVLPDYNAAEGFNFILTDIPNNVALSASLINAFEAGDNRKRYWTDSLVSGSQAYFYAYKYKIKSSSVLSEYSIVLRLAELYLIRAEARAQQNNLTGLNGATDDIDMLRTRAGLQPTSASTQTDLLLAIEQERRVELFTEWGHRWLDLKRTNRADPVLGLTKIQWHSADALYPIPHQEILTDRYLVQNPGY